MEEFIKKYEVKIKALSPIHVGNGEKIGKKAGVRYNFLM